MERATEICYANTAHIFKSLLKTHVFRKTNYRSNNNMIVKILMITKIVMIINTIVLIISGL